MCEPNNRHQGKSFQPRSLEAPMAGKNHIGAVDNQRVQKAEPLYARSDLLDLLFGMGARVSRVGPKPASCIHSMRGDERAGSTRFFDETEVSATAIAASVTKGRSMPGVIPRANAAKSKIRARVEHVFAEQKDRMELFVRTIGIAWAKTKIGMANLVYNFKRLLFWRRTAAA
jgi:hypothetical protein